MTQDFRFIRLLFPGAAQEQVAVRLLRALAAPLGHQAGQVRPETTLGEIMTWAEAGGVGAVELVTALEDGVGMEADLLPHDFEANDCSGDRRICLRKRTKGHVTPRAAIGRDKVCIGLWPHGAADAPHSLWLQWAGVFYWGVDRARIRRITDSRI